MNHMTCPCCTKKLTVKQWNTQFEGIVGVRECLHCGAVFGTCYKGESYTVARPFLHPTSQDEAGNDLLSTDRAFYYDLTTLGGGGIERRHGWADRETRYILQVG